MPKQRKSESIFPHSRSFDNQKRFKKWVEGEIERNGGKVFLVVFVPDKVTEEALSFMKGKGLVNVVVHSDDGSKPVMHIEKKFLKKVQEQHPEMDMGIYNLKGGGKLVPPKGADNKPNPSHYLKTSQKKDNKRADEIEATPPPWTLGWEKGLLLQKPQY